MDVTPLAAIGRRADRSHSYDLDHSQQPNQWVIREGSSYYDVNCYREEELALSGGARAVGCRVKRARATKLEGLL
ncbi:hypothetical protein Pyn_10290 [Prunus yedoensis var. nudiflora]|uniref:Uncharacterized protein n=1 Tax=Prunus yedoensis var. nudiflora TaxID=2094558 RepID=A0A314UNH2_PRUYE|nr:hypothetical protein Pyn_07986 [Prunus yedoensis var. nudiflora]PQP92975.1 hypothetical protein Pyn_10290 [Prunus yedoensis var. nudiflora]